MPYRSAVTYFSTKRVTMYVQSNTQCITMYYMKISKTFRLSKEAIKVLDKQENATEFIESLILDKYQRPMEVVPFQQLKELLDGLSSNGMTADFESANLGSSPSEPATLPLNTPQGILARIDEKKQELAELIEVNQDPEDHRRIQEEIQNLWKMYSLIKGEKG